MHQWTNGFLQEGKFTNLDPVTFAFARFALNVSISFAEVPVEYFISAKVHVLLISLVGFDSDVVAGPAMLALSHLSLIEEMKGVLVGANCLPLVLRHLVKSRSKLILALGAKMLASLAQHPSNKSEIARSGCMHALFDLVQGAHTEVNDDIRYNSVSAIVNVLRSSDSNRVLSIELMGISPLLKMLQISSNSNILRESLHALANMAFQNAYTSRCILGASGDVLVAQLIDATDILREGLVVRGALAVLANLCTVETNQSHVGSSNGAFDCAIRVCAYAR